MGGGGTLYNKGVAVILTSNPNEIDKDSKIFDNENKKPLIDGYVDMLAVAGNDETDDEIPPAYETQVSFIQSKKNAVRRIHFQDTDDNSADSEAADYSATDISAIRPRYTGDGAWYFAALRSELEKIATQVPKFYETYCSDTSKTAIANFVTGINLALTNTDITLDELSAMVETATASLDKLTKKLEYKYDTKVPQIYIATDKGNGASYGTTLTKAIGYVPAQVACIGTDGKIMASDLSWSTQIKVRGNSTAGAPKRPYNIKFSEKKNLFGFGKAKKWVLLADYYDPTLMRNRIALTLGKRLGLETTMDCQRVEVYVDGAYRGMYLLTEKIEDDKNRVNIDTDNGDFLLEMDQYAKTEKDIVHFDSAILGRPFRLHEPEDEDEVPRIKGIVDNFESILTTGDWDTVVASIDVDSFVTFYIVNEFMKNVDFTYKSIYFYYKDGKFYGGPCWDFDWSSANTNSTAAASGLVVNSFHYFKYLTKFLEFQLAISKKLAEAYSSGLFEEIYADGTGWIDSDRALYSDAIDRNYAIWKFVCANRTAESTYEANVNVLTTWLAERTTWLKENLRYGIYDDDDGKYYYVYGQKRTDSGFIEYDGSYYYINSEGKVQTGIFTVDGSSYQADSTGKITELPDYSISYELNGGEVANVNPKTYNINTETFTLNNPSRKGYEFDGWTGTDLSEITKTVTIPKGSRGDREYIANWTKTSGKSQEDDPNKPTFKSHSLILDGEIGVNFYMNLPTLVGVNYEDHDKCYMEFDISGDKSNALKYKDSEISYTENGKTYYGMRCYLSSVQMADTITAVLHYGNGLTVSQDYSVQEYLDAILDGDFSNSAKDLMVAIQNYGYYAQQMLSKANNWTIGEAYTAIKRASQSDYNETEISQAKENTAQYAISRDVGNSQIREVQYSLLLDSKTTINVYLEVKEGYTGTVTAKLDGGTSNVATKLSNSEYLVQIRDIPAHELATVHRIDVEAGGSFTVKVAALSYVNTILNSTVEKISGVDLKTMKNGVTALYEYYDAAMTYAGRN